MRGSPNWVESNVDGDFRNVLFHVHCDFALVADLGDASCGLPKLVKRFLELVAHLGR